MSKNWARDINQMHEKFEMNEAIRNMDSNTLQRFLRFRLDFLEEELSEAFDAYYDGNSEEIVDAMIDLCVVAIGTLDAFAVDPNKAWDRVLKANMAKEPGIKEGRENPLGLPDLIKPEGWKGPDHTGNHGLLHKAFTKKE